MRLYLKASYRKTILRWVLNNYTLSAQGNRAGVCPEWTGLKEAEEELMVNEGILILFLHLFHAPLSPEFQPLEHFIFLLPTLGFSYILFSLLENTRFPTTLSPIPSPLNTVTPTSLSEKESLPQIIHSCPWYLVGVKGLSNTSIQQFL